MPRYQQVVRQWKLLQRLERAAEGINVPEFAQAEAFKERNVYRDLDALQLAGFPLYTETIEGQKRWFIKEAFRKGGGGVPLHLSEILALRCAHRSLETLDGTPFADSLGELIDKLDAQLNQKQLEFARQMDEVFVTDHFGRPDYTEHRPTIDILKDAIAAKYRVQICYCSQQREETTRLVDPYNLWLHQNIIYLIGWCHLRREIRIFSLSRIRDVTRIDESFTLHPEYDFETYARQRFRILSEGRIQRVSIWFAPEAAIYVSERLWHPTQTIQQFPDNSVELTMDVDGLKEISSWILSFGPRARAIEPEELVERVRNEIAGASSYYREQEEKSEAAKKKCDPPDPG